MDSSREESPTSYLNDRRREGAKALTEDTTDLPPQEQGQAYEYTADAFGLETLQNLMSRQGMRVRGDRPQDRYVRFPPANRHKAVEGDGGQPLVLDCRCDMNRRALRCEERRQATK